MNWHHHHIDPTGALYLITAPSVAVVSLEDMKKHLRVEEDDTDDDDVIGAFTEAATSHLDGRDGKLRRALADQTWEWRLSWFPGSRQYIRIPLPPLIEVVSVKYIDTDGTEQTFDAGKYHVSGIGDRGRIQLAANQCWPSLGAGFPEPVIIRFRAGYLNTDSPPAIDVPTPIIAAIKLFTANLYENRQTIVLGQTAIELPWAAEALLQGYRVYD